MAKTVCLLSEREATELRKGHRVDCRRHIHIAREEARRMTLGGKHFPWQRFDNFHANAAWAILSNGNFSNKHIVQHEAHQWRKVTTRLPYGGLGYAGMQLVTQGQSR